MRVALVIHSLGCGGAERVMSIMANYWAGKQWDISLLTLTGESFHDFYELNPRIRRIRLGLAMTSNSLLSAVFNNLRRIRILHKEIRNCNPDVVISFMDKTNILTLLATSGLKLPTVVSERVNASMCPIGKIWENLRWVIYSLAHQIVVQTKEAENYLCHKHQKRLAIIPNPVLQPLSNSSASGKITIRKPCVIGMGRLVQQKGFDLLIRAFAQVKSLHQNWTLNILGDGPLHSELTSLCMQLGVQDSVQLMGAIQNPCHLLQQADLFVLPSRFEGFPNALCEAMACGLPVIASDCPSGPRDIVRHGIDGILVPSENIEALADGLNLLISDEPLRRGFAARAPEIVQRFAVEKIMAMWESLPPIRQQTHL